MAPVFSRRQFLHSAAALPALLPAAAHAAFRPALLPSQKEVWDWQVWMAKLGPKYTGNEAHRTFVEFLAKELGGAGLKVERQSYTFPRWEAKRWALRIAPVAGAAFDAPVISYFPYSGETPGTGVSGGLVYCGTAPHFQLPAGLQGKIALIDCPVGARPYGDWYQPWGMYPESMKMPASVRPARSPVNSLEGFRKAGAVGVVLAWTDISDDNAADHYGPFSRPHQGIPGLWVGREAGARLRGLAAANASATLTLEGTITPNTPTDTLVATLEGADPGEAIIVNTHTDGPNAIEENGGIGLLALARYFTRLPKTQRRRSLAFVLTTGHFAGPWVPSIRGVIGKYPELIRKTAAAVTIEHLGCTDWEDDASFRYRATGENELAVALSPHQSTAKILLEALQGSNNQRTAVVNPVKGGFLGEGSSLARAGIPTIGYMPMPNYLLAGTKDGCIEKVNPALLHGQIQVFAKVLHGFEALTAAQLKA